MRIIAGQYRSRQLFSPPPGSTTRPMPDRVRESLFGILRGNIEGAAVLDAFAGTGVIGLEALSRGAARCVFIERDRRVAEVLKRNIAMLKCEDRAEVVVGDALGLSALARCPRPVDLIFFDPPYVMVQEAMPGGGWDRCRGQFGRFIDLLSDTGFAALRTPWPFLHPDNPQLSSQEPEEPGGGGRSTRGGGFGSPGKRGAASPTGRSGRRGDDARWVDRAPGPRNWAARDSHEEEGDLDDLGELAHGQEADDDLVEGEHSSAAGEGAEQVPMHEVDLAYTNAVGPETHIYRHTAVHLYMRRREQPAAGAPGDDQPN